MKRREAREKAIQALYQMEMTKNSAEEAIASVIEAQGGEKDSYLFQLVEGTTHNLKKINDTLTPFLKGWAIHRLARVDRAILRLSVYELLFQKEIPVAVVIDEAIELAKKFGTEQSSKYVNGVLAEMSKTIREDKKSEH
ncbi:transcription antitermination factor NusB [Microaerobacter geothermalis]|uniref:transcription antitermination factor NusB n=1 Tax=Microaerobacter geothermalis TaxID=674972 RepID=UPI001F40E869|nr:transcription antitermination factor NusB [Microaerobacter geothermalis]MCF6094443.1 transcription antitermination factor NusB [Microaerobacter geothermalis]